MYRDEILDLYRNPLNEGELEDAWEAEAENPNCGDRIHVYVKVEDGKIEDVRHETDGCAISTAAASIVTDELVGMKTDEVKKLGDDWMLEKLGVEVSPMRMKCAVLGLKTVQGAIEKD